MQVMRGGSCNQTEVNSFVSFMRTASRSYLGMSSSYYVGFRCVVPDPDSANEGISAEEIFPGQPGEPLPPEGPRP